MDTLAATSQCSRCIYEEGKYLYLLRYMSLKAALMSVMSWRQLLTSSIIGFVAGLASLPLPQS